MAENSSCASQDFAVLYTELCSLRVSKLPSLLVLESGVDSAGIPDQEQKLLRELQCDEDNGLQVMPQMPP